MTALFRKVVVGHDLEDGGADALALGSALARATGAELLVVKVFPLELVPHGATEEWRAHEFEELSELIHVAGVEGATPDVTASTSRGRGLYEFAEEVGADVIVVGSSSRGTFERVAVGGEVAMVLMHGAPCAVAVAPRGFRERGRAIARIVVGYDGSPESEHALDGAFELAANTDAYISIVGVPPPVRYGTGVGGRQRWQAITRLVEERTRHQLEAAERRAPAGLEVEAFLLDGDPATVLVDAAASADLLVLGSRGYGPVKRVLLGSVSAQLVRWSRAPVLVFPRGAAAERHEGARESATVEVPG